MEGGQGIQGGAGGPNGPDGPDGPTQHATGVVPPRQGALRASRKVYRLHRRRLLLAVLPVYAALTALGLLNALLVVDEGDVGDATLALTYGVMLILAGAFWTMPAVAGALEQGRAATAAAQAGGAATAGPSAPWRQRALAPYRRANTLSGLLLLSCIAIVLVPLVLPARLALALPVAVGEGRGAGSACRRSWRLTRGRMWRTWWLVVLTVVLIAVGSGLSLWAGVEVAGQVDIGDRWSFVLGVVVSLAVASVPLTFASARIGVLWMTWHELLALRHDGALPVAAAARSTAAVAAPAAPAAMALAAAATAPAYAPAAVDDLAPGAVATPGPAVADIAGAAVRPGGFWRRGAALAIDLFVVWLLGGGIAGIIDASVAGEWSTGRIVAVSVGVAAVVWLAYCATLVGWLGQTLGKLALGVQVVDARSGARATWRQSLGRELIRLLLTALVVGALVDYGMLLRGRERRTWHDRRAGTAVVRR